MRRSLILSLAAMLSSPALAGPPFMTDDPVPVEEGHWEVYGFSAATHVAGDTGGILGGVEVNYGAAPNLQLHAIVPVAFDDPAHGRMQTGFGDIELGAKYRLIDSGDDGWQVGVFPLLEIPAGTINSGESPDECARREIVEEINFSAGNLERLFGMYVAPGYSDEYITVYLATDLTAQQGVGDDDEFIEITTLSLKEALKKIATGEIEDAKSIAGLLAVARCQSENS